MPRPHAFIEAEATQRFIIAVVVVNASLLGLVFCVFAVMGTNKEEVAKETAEIHTLASEIALVRGQIAALREDQRSNG